jgi:phosphatidylglycerophosphate synthase
MQAVIAIPSSTALIGKQKTTGLLMRPVSGVPLLKRVILTANRAGATGILLISADALGHTLPQSFLQEVSVPGGRIRVVQFSKFDPRDSSSWTKLEAQIDEEFLWIPWNWVTSKQFLANLPVQNIASVDWTEAAHVALSKVATGETETHAKGVQVTTPESIAIAERFLVANSGKVLDGIHTGFNRKLCRPFVRLLSHTSITPNQVTFGGVVVSVLSATAFAQGGYLYSMLGGLLFYIAGLFDEMDGMLARIKFAESPRGTWLEGFADGLSYVLLFSGLTIGLSHQYGRPAALMGILLLVGTVLALVVTSLQRRRATTADKPNEYLGRMYQLLDKDSGNWISRVVRQLQAFVRRGILIHYVFIFALIGALPLLFLFATLGAHLTWILTLYFNRRFFAPSFHKGAKLPVNSITANPIL